MASKDSCLGTPPRCGVLDSEARCRFGEIAENVAVAGSHFERIVPFTRHNDVDLAIIGADDPRSGTADLFGYRPSFASYWCSYYASSPQKSSVDMLIMSGPPSPGPKRLFTFRHSGEACFSHLPTVASLVFSVTFGTVCNEISVDAHARNCDCDSNPAEETRDSIQRSSSPSEISVANLVALACLPRNDRS